MLSHTRGLRPLMLAIACLGVTQAVHARSDADALIVTSSNTAANRLLVYRPDGTLLRQIPTQGQGGVAGNAGGIAQSRERLAVVNFGSNNVSIFIKDKQRGMLRLEAVIPTSASPVSVAFDHYQCGVASGRLLRRPHQG